MTYEKIHKVQALIHLHIDDLNVGGGGFVVDL